MEFKLEHTLAIFFLLFLVGLDFIEANTFLFISCAFLFTFLAGELLEMIRVPWIFAALLFGTVLSFYNPFDSITSSDSFIFLSQLGMYFLLFIIGFEIDLRSLMKRSSFIIKSTFFIIFLEGIVGTAFISIVFGYDIFVSFVAALSFATVGEALLIPILHEFRMVNTTLGQTIIGIGTLDDVIEILTLILAVFLIGSSADIHIDVWMILASLLVMVILTVFISLLKEEGRKYKFKDLETIFLFTIFILFLFLGIGALTDMSALAALLAGISIGNFLPESRKKLIENEIKAVCYGLFAPLFFVWVGSSLDIDYLLAFPLLVVMITLLSNAAKIAGSLIMGRKELGLRQSVILGIALSVRFSTSIIVVKILYENGLIGSDLFSIIVASTIIFKFLVPTALSFLIQRWVVDQKH